MCTECGWIIEDLGLEIPLYQAPPFAIAADLASILPMKTCTMGNIYQSNLLSKYLGWYTLLVGTHSRLVHTPG